MRTWIALAVLLPVIVGADETTDLMTKGKVAADLGRYDEATLAFQAIGDAPGTSPALRAEALVRLGAVRRTAGDHEGSVKAFERASKQPGLDREAKALLVQALGGVVPGMERWQEVWPKVTFVVDRSDPKKPGLAIRWPDAPPPARPRYTGAPMTLDIKDGDIVDVLRLFGDVAKVNIFIDPSVRGRTTVALNDVPWDEALATVLATNGLRSQREDDALLVYYGAEKPRRAKTPYTGKRIALDLKNGDISDILNLLGDVGGVNIVAHAPGWSKISMRIDQVPWDQVLDVILRMHDLTSRREGTVVWISDGWMPPLRRYTGRLVDVDLDGRMSPQEALERVAKLGDARVAIEALPMPWLGYLRLHLKQVPWDQALDLVARITLHEAEISVEGDQVTVRPIGWVRTGRRPGVAGMRVREVRVRGVVDQKDVGRVAFILGPDGKSYFPKVGQRLHDGRIAAIAADSVTFEEQQDDGTTRLVTKTIEAAAKGGPVVDESPAATPPGTGPSTAAALVAVDAPGVVPPQALAKPRIRMPEQAIKNKIGGTVLVKALVDENGRPADLKLVRGIEHPQGEECNTAALDAVRQMTWTPATKDGVPVKVWLSVRFDF